jgi:hypothetical protein
MRQSDSKDEDENDDEDDDDGELSWFPVTLRGGRASVRA